MDSDKILALCAALKLSDDQGDVHLVGGRVKEEGSKKMSLCLVGKLLAGRQTNREAFRALIPKIWRTNQEVIIEIVRDNTYAFYFQNLRDKKRVLAGGPWNFDNSLLVLEEPQGWGDFTKMQFKYAEFWVQIHNVPLMCMSRDIGVMLGSKIGAVKEIDLGATGDCVGKFIRVRATIDISRPLKRGLRIQLEDSCEEQTLLLRYEKMPEFYFVCGMIGHSSRECPSLETSADGLLHDNHKYGTWLRANSPPRDRQLRTGRFTGTKSAESPPGVDLRKHLARWGGGC
ncbi:hypothetical protein ACOSQ4_004660 [Xanthoceras sorbifolium]